jgi:hypothetical protein
MIGPNPMDSVLFSRIMDESDEKIRARLQNAKFPQFAWHSISIWNGRDVFMVMATAICDGCNIPRGEYM